MNTLRCVAICLLLVVPVGCRAKESPDTGRADVGGTLVDPNTPIPVEFVNGPHEFRLAYPPDWGPAPSDDYVLNLVPVGEAELNTTYAAAAMSVDVPELPLHVPGLIPLGLVVNGYVDDLKKRYPDLRVDESAPTKLAGGNARRVRSTWTADGRPLTEDAVLTTRGDRVYIFRLTADARDYVRARDAYESVLRSVRWEH